MALGGSATGVALTGSNSISIARPGWGVGRGAAGKNGLAAGALRCMVWHGMTWHGMAWHGMAWHGMAWHGMAWHGMAWQAPCVRAPPLHGLHQPPLPACAVGQHLSEE
jgi:hypothetical protein